MNTAFAIANPAVGPANIRMVFRSDANEAIIEKTLALPARGQTARFFTEFLELEEGRDISGSVIFTSDADVDIMSLRTLNGEQTASLPSGTPGN